MRKPDFVRITRHYADTMESIIKAGPSLWGVDPYAWEHKAGIELSPIERALWSDIRYIGLVLYPQFPVGHFFVDFANPAARVAIECDGARWHTDVDRDAERQREIERLGWTVYRLTGVECFADGKEIEEPGRIRYESSKAQKLLEEIGRKHGIRLGAQEAL